jgi:hypothetical protein
MLTGPATPSAASPDRLKMSSIAIGATSRSAVVEIRPGRRTGTASRAGRQVDRFFLIQETIS